MLGVLLLVLTQGDPHGRPAEPGAPTPAATEPGLTGQLGPVPRTCDGVVIDASVDAQAVIDAHPPGTTFCLSAGTHRVDTPLVPERGDALVGDRGAVLSGSRVLTGWRREGRVWTTQGFLPPSPGDHGECRASVPTCAATEDVFRDKRRLERVASRAAVAGGDVYADYRTGTISIGDDPRGHLVEQAVAPALVRAVVDDVTVANLVLEEAANEAQVAAIENRRVGRGTDAGSGWRIVHNEVRLNHGVGVGFGNDTVLRGNRIDHQGQLGFGAWGAGSVVSNNEISFNGTAGYSADWEAGGSKLWMTERLRLAHNHVHDNSGPGLWADGGNMDTTYAWNEIADNRGAGIQHEISYDATIAHNEITGNGRRHKGWAWDAGIQIQSSGGTGLIEVAHNTLAGNANGIVLLDSGHRAREAPTPHGPHVVRNVWVRGNTVTMRGGQTTGAVQDTGAPGIFTTGHNRFEGNTYHLDSLTEPHFSWGDEDLGWWSWRGLGNDHDGTGRAEVLGPGARS
ncbi:hypothetical protein GCM10009844_00390 [Nocardioides koreensis]|uniref:Right handed beta helix domain-containing protein n=2 Tax=Nocardioides koreensis TaxID=433651 RepID=A0ABP5KT21_9ACTN